MEEQGYERNERGPCRDRPKDGRTGVRGFVVVLFILRSLLLVSLVSRFSRVLEL